MLDAAKTVDTLKLRFYIDWLYNNHVYDEGESGFHKDITAKVVTDYIDPLALPLDANIQDLGCGPGYFLDEMKSRGYTNACGVTLSPGDIKICESKGHRVLPLDLSFLPEDQGYRDETVDLIFLRHALEHSPFPMISLIEYNRVLKQGGYVYIEVPAPGCERQHEYNLNHYSILGEQMLAGLLQRAGFGITKFNVLEFDLNIAQADGTTKPVREKFFCILARKVQPLDIK